MFGKSGPQEPASNLIDRISNESELNEEQNIAFRIASRRFLVVQSEYQSQSIKLPSKDVALTTAGVDPALNPLRMFLTGPGGTGKTHVVRALKCLMDAFAAAHRIRYLAPTGSAASLIDGMTVHSGLGIGIKKKSNGKGNRAVGESTQDYAYVMTVSKKQALRAEWKDVWFVLLDEVSMASQQMMCEVDHALRFAREKRNEWFGGINLVISGDMFQFGPVNGSPLYTPITTRLHQSEAEVMKRLGRMAYKEITVVVELWRQQRMKSDPKYAEAVQRFRLRQCTENDVTFFNERVIKSDLNIDGIDMADHLDAVVIVKTNLIRETINAEKAVSNTSAPGSPDLVVSPAKDTIDKVPVHDSLRTELWRINATAIGDDVLPGMIPLFVGMPIILKSRNISTEMKLTNGSQGVVRRIEIEKDPLASLQAFVTCVLVEFPSSPVQLHGLPKGWYAIRPATCTSSITQSNSLNDAVTPDIEIRPKSQKSRKKSAKPSTKISRSQVPIQPGFSVTGHSAQGKTLPKVLIDIRGGGFHAYVGGSRPTSHKGLFLTHHIGLKDLNAKLPRDLKAENRRLKALAKNTLVNWGFSDDPLVIVPDPEGEGPSLYSENVPSLHLPDDETGCGNATANKKRKLTELRELDQNAPAISNERLAKKPKISHQTSLHDRPPAQLSAPFLGCTWDSINYSCAYDTVIMTLFAIEYSAHSPEPPNGNPATMASWLTSGIARILRDPILPRIPTSAYNDLRDLFRNALHHEDDLRWPFIRKNLLS